MILCRVSFVIKSGSEPSQHYHLVVVLVHALTLTVKYGLGVLASTVSPNGSHVHVGSTDPDHVVRDASLVALEVFNELFSEAFSGVLVRLAIGPAVNRPKDLRVDTEALAWHLEVEATHQVEVRHVEGLVMDRVNDSARLRQAHAMADAVAATDPACVDKPNLSVVLSALLREHLSVSERMQRQKGLTVAS